MIQDCIGGLRIHMCRGLIQHQDLGPGKEAPSNGDALRLAAGNQRSEHAHRSVQPVTGARPFLQPDGTYRGHQLLICGSR